MAREKKSVHKVVMTEGKRNIIANSGSSEPIFRYRLISNSACN